jgi:fibronectin type 3 domain-containing protein
MVSLAWTVPADGGSPITGYTVYRGDTTGTETSLVALGLVTTYDDASALSGSTYFYVVTAVNAAGASVWSNEVSVTVP